MVILATMTAPVRTVSCITASINGFHWGCSYQGHSAASPAPPGILSSPMQHQAAHGQRAACLTREQVVARPFCILHTTTIGFQLGVAAEEAESQLLFPGGIYSDLITGTSENSPRTAFLRRNRKPPDHPFLAPKRV